jgi:hypothetical protein
MLFALVSKLPRDLLDVMHILPIWFNLVYNLLWLMGLGLVFFLLGHLCLKFFRYLKNCPGAYAPKITLPRQFSRAELQRQLEMILSKTNKDKNFRSGLHDLSAVLKMYFEVLLNKEIEEMTAVEIKTHVREKNNLGDFFIELVVIQYGKTDPEQKDFMTCYNKSIQLIRT